MTRVYTVKSNARRDCRKFGIDPDLVVPTKGGFRIRKPTKLRAKKPRKAREGQPKRDTMLSMLADWTPLPHMMKALGWQAHTVRGALSTAAKAKALKIERRRVDGVTSYIARPAGEAS